ncbi:MAG: hypothetical protein ABFD44_10750 [Anaerolineaceae bacterium]
MFLNMLLSPLASGHAYLDPSSGSYIIQLALAALVGGGFALKVYWKKIVGHFKKNKGEDMPENMEAVEVVTENDQDGK